MQCAFIARARRRRRLRPWTWLDVGAYLVAETDAADDAWTEHVLWEHTCYPMAARETYRQLAAQHTAGVLTGRRACGCGPASKASV